MNGEEDPNDNPAPIKERRRLSINMQHQSGSIAPPWATHDDEIVTPALKEVKNLPRPNSEVPWGTVEETCTKEVVPAPDRSLGRVAKAAATIRAASQFVGVGSPLVGMDEQVGEVTQLTKTTELWKSMEKAGGEVEKTRDFKADQVTGREMQCTCTLSHFHTDPNPKP